MSTTRAPRIPKAQARDRIRAATMRLLAQGSYRDLTVDAVMAEAGLARTLFYRHFDGLPALVLSLLEDLRSALDEGGDPADPGFLRRVLDRAVAIAHEHGAVLRAIDDAARHDADVDRAYRAFRDEVTDAIAAIFRANVAAGRVRDVPDIRATSHALNLMNGAFLLDVLGPESGLSPDTAADVLWTIWARTLGLD